MRLVRYKGLSHVVISEKNDFGIKSLDLIAPLRRLWGESENAPALHVNNIDPLDVEEIASPAQLFLNLSTQDNWSAQSKRSLAKLESLSLIAEDPQRRLEAREVVTLAHQVSLVRYVLDQSPYRRILIGDEVGLGKTIEVGLIIRELINADPGLRVLYLAPARLVSNVGHEFDKLKLQFRLWKAQDSDARIESDSRVIASIHRAVHKAHYDKVVNAQPWDVIVVDECHHLSDWAHGGGDPVQKFKLVKGLIAKQRASGYFFMLSGTPHQGHDARFENLLRLLKREGETDADLAGKVVFRTKEDIKDWHGNPLFPKRDVKEPTLVHLGDEHDAWLSSIHEYFSNESTRDSDVAVRAAGWKCAQALQWAASSANAGLGYLVRQAIRAGWTLKEPVLEDAIAAMRPYRLGPADELLEPLYERIKNETKRQVQNNDVDDIEEAIVPDTPAQDLGALRFLLSQGVRLVTEGAQPKWETLWERVIQPAGTEKVVLFAQPIETVMALAEWLHHKTGEYPALIIGGQTDAERSKQVAAFHETNGPQFLVSSKAGGEGYNLQISRRLVHLDVPWNPMELEQRVGRVHRFGSRQTILVHTLVVSGSRETQAWAVARERLNTIARSLVSEDRFEALFSRVMCLIPPDDIQSVLLDTPVGPLKNASVSKLTGLIDTGFKQWQNFHDQYSESQRRIRALEPGLAKWSDLEQFLLQHGGAQTVDGYSRGTFVQDGDDVRYIDSPTSVLRLADGSLGLAEDFEGGLLTGEDDRSVQPLGLNINSVARVVREHALNTKDTGAALLRWASGDSKAMITRYGGDIYVMIFLRQVLQLDGASGASEKGSELQIFVANTDLSSVNLTAEDKPVLLEAIRRSGVRVKQTDVPKDLIPIETEISERLRRPSDEQIRNGIRFAIWPVFLAQIMG